MRHSVTEESIFLSSIWTASWLMFRDPTARCVSGSLVALACVFLLLGSVIDKRLMNAHFYVRQDSKVGLKCCFSSSGKFSLSDRRVNSQNAGNFGNHRRARSASLLELMPILYHFSFVLRYDIPEKYEDTFKTWIQKI